MSRTRSSPAQQQKFSRQAKWRERNPQKVWAQAALRSALKRGLVEQQLCCVCGSPDSEAHHPDYAQPANVEWYCRQHHQAEHRRLKLLGYSVEGDSIGGTGGAR